MLDVSASTGGGGRLMDSYRWDLYDWSIQQASDAPSTELQDVAEASVSGGSSKLIIPGEGRASELEVTWFFNVTATNWLGGVGWTSIQVINDIEVLHASSRKNVHCFFDKFAPEARVQDKSLGGKVTLGYKIIALRAWFPSPTLRKIVGA